MSEDTLVHASNFYFTYDKFNFLIQFTQILNEVINDESGRSLQFTQKIIPEQYVMSPQAFKEMMHMGAKLIREYEEKNGKMEFIKGPDDKE